MKISNNELKNLKKILEDDYDNVREFFYYVCTSQFDFKVLITRRSYVLYKIFNAIFEKFPEERLQDIPYNVVGTICNTHSLEQLKTYDSNLVDKDFLVVDDIVINGRTINNIYKHLKRLSIPQNHIKIWAIACNNNALCLDENIESSFGHVIYVEEDEWKILSNSLTEFVVKANIGYVSYVDSYIIENVSLPEITRSFVLKNPKDQVFDNVNSNFERLSISSKIFFCNFKKHSQIEDFAICSCIRVYESEEKVIAIPYIFFPTLEKNNVYDYCSMLLTNLDLPVPDYFIKNPHECYISFYHWTVRTLGELLIKDFLGNISISHYNKYFSCDESFLFNKDATDEPREFQMPQISNIKLNSQNEILCCQVFKDSINENNNLSQTLKSYLSNMRLKDEKRAHSKTDRYLGIRICEIINSLNESKIEFTKHKLLSALISLWDCGKASFVISEDFDENNVVVDGYLRHGEQIYIAYYELFNNVYNVFYELLCETFETRIEQLRKFAQHFDSKYNTNLFSEFVNGINLDHYVTDLMALPPHIVGKDFLVKNAREEILEYYNQA